MSLKIKIRQLIRIVEESNIDELEVSSFWGAQRIRVSKGKGSNLQHVILPSPETPGHHPTTQSDGELQQSKPEEETSQENQVDPELSVQPAPEKVSKKYIELKAPLVGTFYKSSKPGTPPFVKDGDTITKGQIICIIEAMKIFNEIEADHSGKIIEILEEDGSPVEYDQPLFLIDPS